jgi:hypothetical protein
MQIRIKKKKKITANWSESTKNRPNSRIFSLRFDFSLFAILRLHNLKVESLGNIIVNFSIKIDGYRNEKSIHHRLDMAKGIR